MHFQTRPAADEPEPEWSRGLLIERYRSGFLLMKSKTSDCMTWYRPGDRWFDQVEYEFQRREISGTIAEYPALEDALMSAG